MPDFLEGKPADISWYPPDNEEKGKKLGQFFQDIAAPPKNLPKLHAIMELLKKDYPSVTKWAGVGFCWGAKVGEHHRVVCHFVRDTEPTSSF